MVVKKNKEFIFIILFAVIIFVFLFYKIPLSDVYKIIRQVDLRIIIATVSISIISNILVSAYRWKLILNRLNCPISLKESLLIKMGSDSIISTLPLRIGETSRVLYLNRVKNIPYHKSILSILSEYSLNVSMLILFILMGVSGFWITKNNISVSYKSFNAPMIINSLLLNKKINSLKSKWHIFFNSYLKGHLRDFKLVFFSRSILLCTVLLGLSELVNVYLISTAINSSIPLYAILLYVPIIILIGSMPVTFLGIGLRESAVLFFFFRYASPEKILSLGILYSFVEHVIPMMIGLSLTGLFMHKLLFRRNI